MHAAFHSQGTPFVLIPGAGGMASYWHQAARLLEQARQEPIAIDLPGDDASASLSDPWPLASVRPTTSFIDYSRKIPPPASFHHSQGKRADKSPRPSIDQP
jgi:hypothetical protein